MRLMKVYIVILNRSLEPPVFHPPPDFASEEVLGLLWYPIYEKDVIMKEIRGAYNRQFLTNAAAAGHLA